jgi:hypothetical protein
VPQMRSPPGLRARIETSQSSLSPSNFSCLTTRTLLRLSSNPTMIGTFTPSLLLW